MASLGRRRQSQLYLAGLVGRREGVPVDSVELEAAARRRLGRNAAGYFMGSAGAELTTQANRQAFDRVRLLPRMLRDVSQRDLSVELLGRKITAPVLLGPIGALDLAHRRADLAMARAAAAAGIGFVTSNQACFPMEDVARASGDGPRWFQLYWSARHELVESLLGRAERAGYEAIVVTLDTTELGWRPRDLGRGYLPFLRGRGIANYLSDPVFMQLVVEGEALAAPKPGWGAVVSVAEILRSRARWSPPGVSLRQTLEAVRRFLSIYTRNDLGWTDLTKLRRLTTLPILLKGILHPEDARLAVEAGMDGVIVSNHGGRQVDGAVGALDQLPAVVDAVAGCVPVLFDSGIRSGADIAKALALGARAVLIGRPAIYGLALDGERGVRAVIDNLVAELDLTLGLCGIRSVAELDRSALA